MVFQHWHHDGGHGGPFAAVGRLRPDRRVDRTPVDLGWSLLLGAVFGWAIYIVNFLMVAPLIFPWFGMARGGISMFAHVLFGAVLTGSYTLLRGRHRVDQP